MRPLTIKMLHRRLNRITVNEALWLIKVYQASFRDFCLLGRTGSIYAATAADLPRDCPWIKPAKPASLVPVRFLGGPPSKVSGVPRKYYNGSLVTFVVDQVLSVFTTRGVDYQWLMKFNENSVLPVWEQLKKCYPKGLGSDLTPPPINGPRQLPLFDTVDVSGCVENRVIETAKVSGKLIEIYSDGTQGTPRELDHSHSFLDLA